MSDVVVPNFKKLSAMGYIFNNPFARKDSFLVNTQGSEISGYTGQPLSLVSYTNRNMCLIRKSQGGTWSVSPESLSQWDAVAEEMMEHAKQDALASIDRTPYKFLEDVFETNKTYKLLRHPLQQSAILSATFQKVRRQYYARRLTWNLHRGLTKNAAVAEATAWSLSSAWLELRYAFRPLLISTLNIIEQADLNYSKAKTKRARSTGFQEKNLRKYLANLILTNSGGTKYYYDHEIKRELRVSAGILYEDQSPFPHDSFWWKNGLRLKDIPRTIWNVMPYTFVTDRFLNISKTISGVQNLGDPFIQILAGWTTLTDIRNEYWLHTNFQYAAGSPWYNKGFGSSSSNLEERFKTRYPWTPDVLDTVPTFENGLQDTETLIDILAIITSRLTKL